MRDERPLKLIRRSDVPPDHLARLEAMAEAADEAAAAAGKDLQSEFGKTHVALIVGCNQFIRIHRAGEHVGKLELRLDAADQAALETAGAATEDAVSGGLFAMFGWKTIDPMDAPEAACMAAVHAAVRKALAQETSTML